MTTVSTPVKIVALAGLAVALGLGGLLLLTKGKGASGAVTPPPVVRHQAPPTSHTASLRPVVHKAIVHKAPAIKLDPALPLVVRRALLKKPVAVVVVYSSRNAGDRAVFAEARAGAHAAHVGFVAANVALEPIAAAVARWSSSVADPAVLVVRRPGKVVFNVSGPTDRDTVAQAAAAAR